MGEYTHFFENMSYDIFETDDYLEELKKAAQLFRSFDKALDSFIVKQGYNGDLTNADEKVSFITDKLEKAGVPIQRRTIKKWYEEHKMIERKTAFGLCFAFDLQVDVVNDFLRRICLTRGFDCHSIEEVVYFFAFKNGLSYAETMEIIKQVEVVKPDKMAKEDIVYTDLIAEELETIDTAGELVSYLNENAHKFEYNNATAYEAIQTIWKDISKENGIALREKKMLYIPFDKDIDDEQDKDTDKKRKARKRIDDSIWEIYLQILGLSGNYADSIYKDRSIKTILKDNELLHPLAEDSFPDRDGLNKILNGEHVSYERVRKILILLVFYRFWANKALGNQHYEAGYDDVERCIFTINDNLIDAGYPLLYPGNPYDFIVLACMNAKERSPL